MVARDGLVLPSVVIEPGSWKRTNPSVRNVAAQAIMLVLDGLLLSDVVLAGYPSAELIGPGDVLWSPDRCPPGDTLLPVGVELTALEPTRVAVLDEQLQLAAARWPPVVVALLNRMEQRGWRLAKQAAICHLPTVHLRLLALFWHLAERWGKVAPGHLVLPVRILHRTLGQMVGADRSTVSLALRHLSDAGSVTRRPDGAWILSGDPREALELWADRGPPRFASLVTDADRGGKRSSREQSPERAGVCFQR